MTKKQFEWLKKHQPISISCICPYSLNGWGPYVNFSLRSTVFLEDAIRIKGILWKYINEKWIQLPHEETILRKNIRYIRYSKVSY